MILVLQGKVERIGSREDVGMRYRQDAETDRSDVWCPRGQRSEGSVTVAYQRSMGTRQHGYGVVKLHRTVHHLQQTSDS
jgi:hypothetical protein